MAVKQSKAWLSSSPRHGCQAVQGMTACQWQAIQDKPSCPRHGLLVSGKSRQAVQDKASCPRHCWLSKALLVVQGIAGCPKALLVVQRHGWLSKGIAGCPKALLVVQRHGWL